MSPDYISIGGRWIEKSRYEVKPVVKEEEPKVNLDITGDGKVDDEDASLAGKVLANAAKKVRKKRATKKKN